MNGRPSEEAVAFECRGSTLIGVLHHSSTPSDIAVVVVVGGPQYRVGSHRQFVELGRALAKAGVPVFRFDVRGMGDSQGEPQGFEHQRDDIDAAINALQQRAGVTHVVLWGLCDGASSALLYLHDTADARVVGLCLVNPWVRSEESLARTQVKHYYGQRLLQASFWAKLIRGKVGLGAVRSLLQSIARFRRSTSSTQALRFQQRMALAWERFPGPTLLLLSGDDYTAKEFIEHAVTAPMMASALKRPTIHRIDMPDADHTFSGPGMNARLCEESERWLLPLHEAYASALSERLLTDAWER